MGSGMSSAYGAAGRKLPPLPAPKTPAASERPVVQEAKPQPPPAPVEPTPDVVKAYLKKNPKVLDEFIDKSVDVNRLKEWIKKKDPSVLEPPPPKIVKAPTPEPKPVTVDREAQSDPIKEPEPPKPEPPKPEPPKPVLPPKTSETTKPKLKSGSITNAALAPRERLMTEALNIKTRFTDAEVYKLVKEVTNDALDSDNSCKFTCEVASVIAIAIRADKYYMYVANENDDTLSVCCAREGSIMKCVESIKNGKSVAAQAAKTREIVIKEELVKSDKPLDPCSEDAKKVKSTLCLPLITINSECVGVMEYQRFYCSPAFTDDHFQVASAIISWVGSLLGLCKSKMSVGSFHQIELNDFLLEVSKAIFSDIISIDNLISRIMEFVKHLVKADRCSFFLVDEAKNELFADLFDEGEVDDAGNPIFAKKEQIRFPKDKGIAGLVASTGNVVNIHDAYEDPRFNRDIDVQTGFKTRNILCMPIVSKGKVIGVVEMINRTAGDHFTETDESSFRSFSVYCALALHYSILYGDLKRNQIQNQVAIEQLSYHIQATEDELHDLRYKPAAPIPDDFCECTFYSKGFDIEMPRFVLHMAKDLFGDLGVFDMDKLAHFTLTVRKNYRPVVYHNWRHGFTVAHCMYWILKQLPDKFSVIERQALFFGSLCHDLDHRGFSNSFMQKLDQPLAALYSTSVMEQHHYNMTITILHQENHDIFNHLTKEQYKEMLEEIRLAIIATDLALYFGNQKKLSGLIDSNAFDLDNREHRNLLKAVMMTGCDLCAVCKPWTMQQETVRYIYAEFYAQGDEEKRRGLQPIPMMDRNNVKNIPNEQVGFLKFVCLPGYKNLADLYPSTNLIDLYNSCSHNCSNWEKIAADSAKSKTPIWDVDLPNSTGSQ